MLSKRLVRILGVLAVATPLMHGDFSTFETNAKPKDPAPILSTDHEI